jgi:integrase
MLNASIASRRHARRARNRRQRDLERDGDLQKKVDKRNGERSVEETPTKLRRFFEPNLDDALEVLTQPRCEKLYKRMTEMKRTKSGPGGKRIETDEPIAVATHRHRLSEARSFTRWCVGKRWLKANPLAEVQGTGKRNHGKKQLRIDDARVWAEHALKLAEAGDRGSLAALMTFKMGNRTSEITQRRVGDVDDKGRVLWIEEAKTEENNGAMKIPDDLQPLIRTLVKGRHRDEWLFPAEPKRDGTVGPHWRDWPRENVQRICKLAGVQHEGIGAHPKRGLHSSVLYEEGAAGNIIARSMRHRQESTTRSSYAKKSAVKAGQQKRALVVLKGGRR